MTPYYSGGERLARGEGEVITPGLRIAARASSERLSAAYRLEHLLLSGIARVIRDFFLPYFFFTSLLTSHRRTSIPGGFFSSAQDAGNEVARVVPLSLDGAGSRVTREI